MGPRRVPHGYHYLRAPGRVPLSQTKKVASSGLGHMVYSTVSLLHYSRSVVIVHTKTHRPAAGRCFQMPGGALGPGFPPRALPLPKNPEK